MPCAKFAACQWRLHQWAKCCPARVPPKRFSTSALPLALLLSAFLRRAWVDVRVSGSVAANILQGLGYSTRAIDARCTGKPKSACALSDCKASADLGFNRFPRCGATSVRTQLCLFKTKRKVRRLRRRKGSVLGRPTFAMSALPCCGGNSYARSAVASDTCLVK